MAYFEVVSEHMLRGTDKNHEILSHDRQPPDHEQKLDLLNTNRCAIPGLSVLVIRATVQILFTTARRAENFKFFSVIVTWLVCATLLQSSCLESGNCILFSKAGFVYIARYARKPRKKLLPG